MRGRDKIMRNTARPIFTGLQYDSSFMFLGGAFISMGTNTNANTYRPPVRTTMPPAGAFLPMGGAYMPPAGTFMPTAIDRAFTLSSREKRVRRGGGIEESSQYYIDGMNKLYQDYLADIGY
ncbi:hypothetical protein ASPWEDRAFT_30394 [Aspergillus wentii DTO 134E9]|uniref:Uncharacterized protein n=1 Tax=Aspergillus wentii DTO 134E9 TaxID=1073089 RepID=A0A1L9REH0_ASPWE|nr:uncharacterized protein ASPWEDRAFT_30394 [Aspergillus wentii DTO 134E9]OJJ33305.1 hypothetical protein ASPWEDRAFT_30394 [Aspergillus wentii DTO 134E9]